MIFLNLQIKPIHDITSNDSISLVSTNHGLIASGYNADYRCFLQKIYNPENDEWNDFARMDSNKTNVRLHYVNFKF